jgi:ADP-L-glycero-D-manno-heptose 6-epimerase
MIIVTGGAGFIGSRLIKELNNRGVEDIIIVDDMSKSNKFKNMLDLKFES